MRSQLADCLLAAAKTLQNGANKNQSLVYSESGTLETDLNESDSKILVECLGVQVDNMKQHLDTENLGFFTIEMSILVFMMQCGFAFLEAGSVRSKNATNILIKNMVDCFVAVLAFWWIGWAFAFGTPSNAFCGFGEFLGIGLDAKNYHKWFFQFMFAANAATIVSGSMAERSQFTVYIGVSALMSGFTYPLLAHWIWAPGGWLKDGPGVQFMDFAGSGAVHLHGGITALCGATILGPRIGAFVDGKKNVDRMSGHSVPFAALGGWLLMFGFFGFNGGSVIGQGQGSTIVALAVINTIVSAAASTLSMLVFTHFVLNRKYSLLQSINCALAGMVAACAGCDQLQPWASGILGVCASFTCLGIVKLTHDLQIDDPLDAVAVHAGGGLVGLIMSPLLGQNGIFVTWEQKSFVVFAWNVLGTAVIIIWTVLIALPLFLLMKKFGLLRVSVEVEEKGLDVYYHDEAAYPLIAYGSGWADDLLSSNNPDSTESLTRPNVAATNTYQNGVLTDFRQPGPSSTAVSAMGQSSKASGDHNVYNYDRKHRPDQPKYNGLVSTKESVTTMKSPLQPNHLGTVPGFPTSFTTPQFVMGDASEASGSAASKRHSHGSSLSTGTGHFSENDHGSSSSSSDEGTRTPADNNKLSESHHDAASTTGNGSEQFHTEGNDEKPQFCFNLNDAEAEARKRRLAMIRGGYTEAQPVERQSSRYSSSRNSSRRSSKGTGQNQKTQSKQTPRNSVSSTPGTGGLGVPGQKQRTCSTGGVAPMGQLNESDDSLKEVVQDDWHVMLKAQLRQYEEQKSTNANDESGAGSSASTGGKLTVL